MIDMWSVGSAAYTSVVWVVNLRIAMQSRNLTLVNLIAIFGSILVWYIFAMIYNGLKPGAMGALDKSDNLYYVIFKLYQTAGFWLQTLVVTIIALLPPYISMACRRVLKPSGSDILQEKVGAAV